MTIQNITLTWVTQLTDVLHLQEKRSILILVELELKAANGEITTDVLKSTMAKLNLKDMTQGLIAESLQEGMALSLHLVEEGLLVKMNASLSGIRVNPPGDHLLPACPESTINLAENHCVLEIAQNLPDCLLPEISLHLAGEGLLLGMNLNLKDLLQRETDKFPARYVLVDSIKIFQKGV